MSCSHVAQDIRSVDSTVGPGTNQNPLRHPLTALPPSFATSISRTDGFHQKLLIRGGCGSGVVVFAQHGGRCSLYREPMAVVLRFVLPQGF
jgi:hypothetical protein